MFVWPNVQMGLVLVGLGLGLRLGSALPRAGIFWFTTSIQKSHCSNIHRVIATKFSSFVLYLCLRP